MAAKRKKVVLSIQDKLELIKSVESGASKKQMCLRYGIGESTVRDIMKQKDKLIEFASSSDNTSTMTRRKTMKKSTYEELDLALLEWVSQVRSQGTPISGPIIVAKAKTFFEMLNLEGNFDASSGWLTRFKQRHGIREIGLHGEKLSGDEEAAREFQSDFEQLIESEGLTYEQVYNADESGLFWKCLPTRTLAFETEKKAAGHKSSKERITFMPCNNASGSHKLKLVVIGKSKRPRSFKGTRAENLPVHYYNQKKGWMNQQIFKDWFDNKFIPQVREHLRSKNLPEKAVLLLDNAPSHPGQSVLKSDDGNFFVKFLPPNVTALIQPMDQGVIASMKKKYRTSLLKKRIDEGDDLVTFFKTYTVLDSIYDISNSWRSVKQSTLMKSWRKILPAIEITQEGEEDEDDVPLSVLANLAKSVAGGVDVNEENIVEWIECDANDPGFEHLTDENIINQVRGIESEDNEDEEEMQMQRTVTHDAALGHIDSIIQYLEEQDDASLCDKMVLRKLKSQIKIKCFSTKKQKQMTDFFVKQ